MILGRNKVDVFLSNPFGKIDEEKECCEWAGVKPAGMQINAVSNAGQATARRMDECESALRSREVDQRRAASRMAVAAVTNGRSRAKFGCKRSRRTLRYLGPTNQHSNPRGHQQALRTLMI